MFLLGSVPVWFILAVVCPDQFPFGINLHGHHVPHDLHRLTHIFVRHAIEMTLGAYTNMVRCAKFYLLTHTEAIHFLRQRTHVWQLVLLEDFPPAAAFVRQDAILVQKLPNAVVDV